MKHILTLLLLISMPSLGQIQVLSELDFQTKYDKNLAEMLMKEGAKPHSNDGSIIARKQRLQYVLEAQMKENGLFLADINGNLSVTFGFSEQQNLNLATFTVRRYGISKETGNFERVIDTLSLNSIAPRLKPIVEKFYVSHIDEMRSLGEGPNGFSFFNDDKLGSTSLDILENKDTLGTLRNLDLSNLGLTKIPKAVYKCKNLEKLDLSNNALKKIPRRLWSLKKLKTVTLTKNLLKDKSIKTKRQDSLSLLNLQFNRITKMPKSLRKFGGLNDLFLGNNYLSNFHNQKFKKLPPIKNLNLYNGGLKAFPKNIGAFIYLQELDVYYNELRALSDNIGQLGNLKTLAVANNDLWDLPQEIGQLKKLETLFAHHNKLDKLPELPVSIRLLDVGYNQFKSFPEQILNLSNLKELDVSNNSFEKLPQGLLKLQNLGMVFMANCTVPLRESEKLDFENLKKELESKGLQVR
ncbi:hypothetical protein [uncultured Arcticibacterium sp.]|uniref:leucine-rich repeat domain-containing protein n=1 Tax=uncultured Arcticibacterium sp. TaxID=2173042 RepID=UPI0030F972BE